MAQASTISVRLDKPVLKELEKIENKWQTDRSETIRRLLVKSIEEWKRKTVIDLFAQHKISIGKAAELLDVSISEMLNIAKEYKIEFAAYGEGELEEELKILGV